MGKISLEEKYMREAIRQAKKALVLGEVPIGCVIEYQGKIIGRGSTRQYWRMRRLLPFVKHAEE